MKDVYLTSLGSFLPGQAVRNDEMESVLGMVGDKPSKYRRRILRSNGITSRHYAMKDGKPTHLNEELAALAAQAAVEQSPLELKDIGYLATGTTLADLLMPGFATMVHGRLATRPMETLSASGVCCAGMAALKAAYNAVRLDDHASAIAVASENPSAMLKGSRFQQESIIDGEQIDKEGSFAYFNADFLRWMLSDGAGAAVLQNELPEDGLALKIEWISMRSFANELPVCMYAGTDTPEHVTAGHTWLAYNNVAEAEAAGLMVYRQDTRLLEKNVVRLASQEAARLQSEGRFKAEEVDHFLPHYSSHFFREKLLQQMHDDGVAIDESKWFTNLSSKGNTGAASIYIMLDEAVKTGRIKNGEKILLMVPESARFSYSYALLTCINNPYQTKEELTMPYAPQTNINTSTMNPMLKMAMQASPLGFRLEESSNPAAVKLGRELALVWMDFDYRMAQIPLIQHIEAQTVTLQEYLNYLQDMRAQVVEGARWITRAASNMQEPYIPLRKALIAHAATEQSDFMMLEQNFIACGGDAYLMENPRKNIGTEGLSAFIFSISNEKNPIALFGGTFIFEGLGCMKAGPWAKHLQAALNLADDAVSFLAYHGANDEDHYENLIKVFQMPFITEEAADAIVKSAKVIAYLYASQLACIGQY